MSATQVEAASLKKLFTAAGKSLPEGMNEATFNSVRDVLLTHIKNTLAAEKSKAKAAEKKADKHKRGPTGYFLYMQETRASVKATMPDAKITEISSKIGENWRALTDKKRAEWNAKAKALAPQPTAEQKAAAEAAAAKPKRPLTAYFVFMAEMRPKIKAEHPDWDVKQLASEAGARWRALSQDEKDAYKQDSGKSI